MRIHPTAIIAADAELGENVEVGPYSVIEENVIIGDGTKIAASVIIASGSRLGKEVKVFPGAVIGTIPQDLKFTGEETTVEVGDRTVVREFCTINRGTKHSHKTVVGTDCLLMAYSHIAHDCHIGNNVILANAVNMGGHVIIEDWVIIGGMVAIHQFVHIGEHAMVGGKFRVAQDVPPYCLAGGWDLKFEGLNSVGLRRRGFTPEQRRAIKEAYRLIYNSNILRTEALAQLKASEMTEEVRHIVEFFEKSERGVI